MNNFKDLPKGWTSAVEPVQPSTRNLIFLICPHGIYHRAPLRYQELWTKWAEFKPELYKCQELECVRYMEMANNSLTEQ